MSGHRYLVALGSNKRHVRHGKPRAVVATAIGEMERIGRVIARSRIIPTPPLGPSHRRYANAVAILETGNTPPELLEALKGIERRFGRRKGRRWGARVLDLDIVLWSGGAWSSDFLHIPHPEFTNRDFVLEPASEIAPRWRDPLSGFSVRQLNARLTKPRAVPR